MPKLKSGHSETKFDARQPVKTGARVEPRPTFNQKRKAARVGTTAAGAAVGALVSPRHPIVGGAAGGVVGNRVGAAAYPYRGVHKPRGKFHTATNTFAGGAIGYAAGSKVSPAVGVAAGAVGAGTTYQLSRHKKSGH